MKYKILNILKNSSDFVSGEEIGVKLSISRSAVWKNISSLRKEGYEIESVSNKGYKLSADTDILNVYEIKSNLNTKFMGQNCCYFDTVTSTNDIAKEKAINGADEGTVVAADMQTAGKGRQGRSWKVQEHSGLSFSIILRPDIVPIEAPQITLIIGIAVCRTLKNFTQYEAYIKWPNDIIIYGKKAVGILTEMNAEIERVNYIIAGIGINVNMESFDSELKDKAISLKIAYGKTFSRSCLLQAFLKEFEDVYLKFISSGFAVFSAEYENLCITIGKDIAVIEKNNTFYARAIGINNDGSLVVEKNDGSISNVYSGDVSVRLADGSYI